jgi:hypothetical protein
MLYMVIEHFKAGQAPAVYRRFRARGRMAPEGLTYISSWIDQRFERCFQVMETSDIALLAQWMAIWDDLIDFEVVPVITSAEAVVRMAET